MLLLYSRLAPELVTGTVKKSKLLQATVLKHRADQQQTKSFVYIWCSSRPKLFVCCCSDLCFKTVAPSSLLFLTVPVTSLGPSPQSSTPCQQTFPAVQYVWFGWHWGLKKSLMAIPGLSLLALSQFQKKETKKNNSKSGPNDKMLSLLR